MQKQRRIDGISKFHIAIEAVRDRKLAGACPGRSIKADPRVIGKGPIGVARRRNY